MGALRLDEGARRLSRNRGRGGEGGRISVVAKGSGVLGPRAALRDPRVRGAMSDCKGGIVGDWPGGMRTGGGDFFANRASTRTTRGRLEKGRRAQR